MAFTPQTAPQTPFALGNTGVSTSEKMKAADAVFGGDLVAPVVPVTDPEIANCGFKGVSAGSNAPVTGSSGTIVPALSTIGEAVGLAADRAFLGGWGSAIADAGTAVLAGLSGSEVTTNTGAESATTWSTNEVREILKILDPTPSGRWADKVHIVGDAAEHWWFVYAFTGWNSPSVDIDYTNGQFLKSITVHVPPNWTSLQVAEFIYKNIAGNEALKNAILMSSKIPRTSIWCNRPRGTRSLRKAPRKSRRR